MSDFTKRLRQIESENSECSILAGNCADAIEIEQKKVAIEIARLRAENEKLRAAVNALVPVVETFVNPIKSPDFSFAMQYQNEWRNEGAKALAAAAAALKETGDDD